MVEVIEVHVNCSSKTEAERIARAALDGRLAASANLFPAISSTYHWKHSVETTEEFPLVLKSTDVRFAALAELIGSLHAYETPSIIGHRIDQVSADYRDWIIRETDSNDA